MQHTHASGYQGSGMFPRIDTFARRFDAYQLDGSVLNEGVEYAYAVAAASHACYHVIREPSDLVKRLAARLTADHALKVAHDCRVGVHAHGGPYQVVGGRDVRDPVAHCFVDRIFESSAT